MSALFRYLKNGLVRKVKEDLPEEPEEIVGKDKDMPEQPHETVGKDMEGDEDEEVFVLANSQTEEFGEENDEIVVLYEKSKDEMDHTVEAKTFMGSPKSVGDATMAGQVWERMNGQANITSGFQDTTLAKVLSEASLSPKIESGPGDRTLAGQIWRKYDEQADITHFQDTTLARVLSDTALQSPEMKRDEQTVPGDKTLLWSKYNEQADMTSFQDTTLAKVLSDVDLQSPEKKREEQTVPGDKTLLWSKYNEQADMTHFQDTTLCQILAKVVVSPGDKSIEEGKKSKMQMGDKTMLNNMWNDVNREGEVTLMGRIERQTAAAASDFNPAAMSDLPSPLQSQVVKN